jgi:hypothetical protein
MLALRSNLPSGSAGAAVQASMRMRGLWYVFRGHSRSDLYQAVADHVDEVVPLSDGWYVAFKGSLPDRFLSRSQYQAPYLGKRVDFSEFSQAGDE